MDNPNYNSNNIQKGKISNEVGQNKNINSIQKNIINNQNGNINSIQNENKNFQTGKEINDTKTNEINGQSASANNQSQINHTENQSITNLIGNDNKNDSNQKNPTSNKININNISNLEIMNQNILPKKDIIDNNKNIDQKKNDVINNKINQNQFENASNDNNENQINENNKQNNNDNNINIINEINTDIEIKEFKDIYHNIDVKKVNIIFNLINKEKHGYKIPSNLTGKEIYYIAYNLCEDNKEEFEYKKSLKLYYKAIILENDDTLQTLKNNDEIVIAQSPIAFSLNFESLKKGKNSKKKMQFIFSDSSKQIIKVDLPGEIKDQEIQDHISSIYNKLFDNNRIKCELYFNNKIYESKNVKIENINLFNKLKNINFIIKVKNIISLQEKPGQILKVQIQENRKLISEIYVGTFEKIKDFFVDLKKELVKKKYGNYIPSFKSDEKIINLNENDNRTFFSINIRKNFICIISPPPVKKRK